MSYIGTKGIMVFEPLWFEINVYMYIIYEYFDHFGMK